MSALATKAQIGAIHALKAKARLSDADYRAGLAEVGAASSKELSREAAGRFIDRLKALLPAERATVEIGGQKLSVPLARGAMRLEGPYAGVSRALWLSAWNLGLLRERSDQALVAFVRRQTGIDHVNWLRDPADARRVIEALKAWIARDGGVVWPREQDGLSRKLAVVEAQRRILAGRPVEVELALTAIADGDLDETMAALGRKIRRSAR